MLVDVFTIVTQKALRQTVLLRNNYILNQLVGAALQSNTHSITIVETPAFIYSFLFFPTFILLAFLTSFTVRCQVQRKADIL